jgi:hypothetical protein
VFSDRGNLHSQLLARYQLAAGIWWRDARRRYFRSPACDNSPGNPILYGGLPNRPCDESAGDEPGYFQARMHLASENFPCSRRPRSSLRPNPRRQKSDVLPLSRWSALALTEGRSGDLVVGSGVPRTVRTDRRVWPLIHDPSFISDSKP